MQNERLLLIWRGGRGDLLIGEVGEKDPFYLKREDKGDTGRAADRSSGRYLGGSRLCRGGRLKKGSQGTYLNAGK